MLHAVIGNILELTKYLHSFAVTLRFSVERKRRYATRRPKQNYLLSSITNLTYDQFSQKDTFTPLFDIFLLEFPYPTLYLYTTATQQEFPISHVPTRYLANTAADVGVFVLREISTFLLYNRTKKNTSLFVIHRTFARAAISSGRHIEPRSKT